MAYYSESGYCAEDVRRPYAEPGYRYGAEGGERYAAVRKEYEEIDEVARAGRQGHHYGHGGQYGSGHHLGRSGSRHHHHHHAVGCHGGHEGSCHGHLGEHREQQHHVHGGHGHGYGHGHGGRHYDACAREQALRLVHRRVLRLSARVSDDRGELLHGHGQGLRQGWAVPARAFRVLSDS
jgi:hypothetical protein